MRSLSEHLRLDQSKLREQRSQSAQFDLDLKTRDEKIEKLRAQQQTANTNREYQAFLVEINTEKLDKAKVEEQLLQLMEIVEKLAAETAELQKKFGGEKRRNWRR